MSLMMDALHDLQNQDPPSPEERLQDSIARSVEGMNPDELAPELEDAWIQEALHIQPILDAVRPFIPAGSEMAAKFARLDAFRIARNKMRAERLAEREEY